MTVTPEEIWVPDVTIYNTVGITQEEVQPTNIGRGTPGHQDTLNPAVVKTPARLDSTRRDTVSSLSLTIDLSGTVGVRARNPHFCLRGNMRQTRERRACLYTVC